MNTTTTAIDRSTGLLSQDLAAISEPLIGADLAIGNGFDAQSFRANDIGKVMDPLVMVDHYVMTMPTFGVHPHAGMSAVSLLFEDSEGSFHNRDSLGNDFDLQPGDLYWLKAGSGAVHDESPRVNSRIHGLQVFVNVPESQRFDPPESLLVRDSDMPIIANNRHRVKIALGESHGVRGAISPSTPMTVLDGSIYPGEEFSHETNIDRGVWVHAIEGDLKLVVGEYVRTLETGQALAISAAAPAELRLINPTSQPVRFALFDGQKINETYVQDGPFVMGSKDHIADIKAAHASGRLGNIE